MKLFLSYMSLHLKIDLEYKLSFILSTISQLLIMIVDLFIVDSLFKKFNLLTEFNIHEIMFGFSAIWLGYSISEMIGRGFDEFSYLIINGSFDNLLIRPRNIYLQIFGSQISYKKISKIILSFIMYIYYSIKIIVNFNILKLLLLITIIIGIYVVMISIYIIGASFCFKTVKNLEFMNIFMSGTRQANQYPLKIYNKPVRFIFTYIIPVALMNYYPIRYLKGQSTDLIYLIMPFYSLILLFFSIKIFNKSLNHYTSIGC